MDNGIGQQLLEREQPAQPGRERTAVRLVEFMDQHSPMDGSREVVAEQRTSWPKRFIWWVNPRSWLRAILMLNDSPHSIALGTAVGVFVAMTPTVGIQMGLVIFIALILRPLLRFNCTAGLIAVYISNPLTMIPIYWFNYKVGTLFVQETVTRQEFTRLFHNVANRDWWSWLTQLLVTVGTPLLIGSLIVATFSAALTYPLILRLLNRVRPFRWQAASHHQ